jgi:HEAT repeat protein
MRGLLACLLGTNADLLFEYAPGKNRDGSRKVAAVTIMSSSFEPAAPAAVEQPEAPAAGPAALFETARAGKTGNQRAEALGQLIAAEGIDPARLLATLQTALTDVNGEVRAQAVFGLGQIGGPVAHEAFRTALADRDAGVRLMAVDSLQPDEQGRILLQESLSDRDPSVRELAAIKLTPGYNTLAVRGRPL